MARPPDTKQPRDQYLRVRVTADERALIEKLRGPSDTSTAIRRLIREEAQREGLL